uniref:MLC1351.15c n=1 Tax=Mycobacterium leprae TaxID=1769 RepID=Q49899_MYCLR|nr:unknown [Mycobacterium leprae]CAB08288.1 unnamed protein product [Mycobacterium leprae]
MYAKIAHRPIRARLAFTMPASPIVSWWGCARFTVSTDIDDGSVNGQRQWQPPGIWMGSPTVRVVIVSAVRDVHLKRCLLRIEAGDDRLATRYITGPLCGTMRRLLA